MKKERKDRMALDSEGKRVGDRIRTIRKDRGLSQSELGSMVGLSADRIQKYENGARKPKTELLNKIADSLAVSPLALKDPTLDGYINAMFAMFEMEDNCGVRIDKNGDKFCLTIDENNPVYNDVYEWHKEYEEAQRKLNATSSEEEKAEILKKYLFWKWNYPNSLADKVDEAGEARIEVVEK